MSSRLTFSAICSIIMQGIIIQTFRVFLPTKKGISNAAYHPSLHTNIYYENVTKRLRTAKSKDDALSILNEIGQELQNGTFPR